MIDDKESTVNDGDQDAESQPSSSLSSAFGRWIAIPPGPEEIAKTLARIEGKLETPPASSGQAEPKRKKTRRPKGWAGRIVAKFIAENAYRGVTLQMIEDETGVPTSTAHKQDAWPRYQEFVSQGVLPNGIADGMQRFIDPDETLRCLIKENPRKRVRDKPCSDMARGKLRKRKSR